MLVAVVIGDGGGYSFKSGVVGWKLIRSLAKLPTEHPLENQSSAIHPLVEDILTTKDKQQQ